MYKKHKGIIKKVGNIIIHDGTIDAVRSYNKAVFWRDYFDNDAFKIARHCTAFSVHLWDYLQTDNDKVKRGHDFTMNDINIAWKKIINKKCRVYEIKQDISGYTVQACFRTQIDDKTDLCLVLWFCTDGIIEIHTAWKMNHGENHAITKRVYETR